MRFPPEEYHRRYAKAQEWMEKKKLKGLFITEGGNYTYFSGGTRDFSFSRPQTLLLPRQGDPIAIIQRLQGATARKEIWFDDIRIYESMLGLPVDMIIEAMATLGMNEGLIGAELGYEQRLGISLNDFIKLKEALPGAEIIDAADIFWGIRMIKSPEEIERHRRACKITVKAYNELFSSIHAGMGEKEIVERFLQLQIDSDGEAPWAFINSGPENYNTIGNGRGNRKIQKGNQIWIDGGCSYREYASDFCCAGTVGPPSDEQRKMQEIVAEITKVLSGAVRPGTKACDINAINLQEWEKRGYDYSKINRGAGRIGHGLGNPYCLTEPPHIASFDDTEIRPGMVFTLEPGIVTEYGRYTTELDIAVNKDGFEILNEMDWELRVIPV
jgi:Xaa-Pro aminopeptidase